MQDQKVQKETDVVIIGGGISGLSLALILKYNNINFLLLEKNDYFGGHARTISINNFNENDNLNKINVDTGFIVFNKINYPQLTAFLKFLKVDIAKSTMSFSSSNQINNKTFQYSSNPLSLLFNIKNLFNIHFYKMLYDIVRFNLYSKKVFKDLPDKLSLKVYLKQLKVGKYFINYYILPMGGCIWSMPKDEILNFPAKQFLQFFYNHNLLSVFTKYQWYCIKNGSINYVQKVIDECKNNVIKNCNVFKITRTTKNISVHYDNNIILAKKIVFACHSDTALNLLSDSKTHLEHNILSNIIYKSNINITHNYNKYMPKNKFLWSSWNYFSNTNTTNNDNGICLTYWVNILQNINKKYELFSTLNPKVAIPESNILDSVEFEHPQFNLQCIKAQQDLQKIQGENNTYFIGAYTRYGFHEDGILSAVNIAKKMGLNIPWDNLVKDYGK